MTNALYNRADATVKRMLAKYGLSAIVHRTNPLTQAVTTFPTQILIVRTVQKVIGDTTVQLGDDELMMQSGVTPQHGDRILYGSENRVLVQPSSSVNPGGQVVMTQCYARKG